MVFIIGGKLIAQTETNKGHYDYSFVKNYKTLALYPGSENKRVIRKWKENIKIFISGDTLDKIKSEVEKYIELINPCLNRIKMSIVDNKDEANFLILLKYELPHVDKKSDDYRYSEIWDDSYVIYKAIIEINKETTTLREQKSKIQRDLLISLGSFSCKDLDKDKVDCKICYTTSALSDFDLSMVKAHYSDLIKVGMNDEEVTKALLDSTSIEMMKNEKQVYNSISKIFKVKYNPNIWKCYKDTMQWDLFLKSKDNLLTISGKEFITKINKDNIEAFYRNVFNKASFKLESFNIHSEVINGIKVYIIDEESKSTLPQYKGNVYRNKIYHCFINDKSFELNAFSDKKRFDDDLLKIYDVLNSLSK
jgi:hypothetical protein